MNDPDFIICGAQKAGTTSLLRYLRSHPEIFMPNKEVHFFDRNYLKGLEWYKSQFADNSVSIKVYGEKCPEYMYLENVPERIYQNFPNIKLIFILRNPLERAYSGYWHEVKNGRENLPFEKAIKKEEERLKSEEAYCKIHCSYIDRGKYIEQLKRFEYYFSKD
ncbi:hypothetical protein EFE41_03125 [Methanohalophilus portucalensis FDF-1]|nr:hypothetical protein EFE41_03125 [Methanohalophilus portucalensis FDF-1]